MGPDSRQLARARLTYITGTDTPTPLQSQDIWSRYLSARQLAHTALWHCVESIKKPWKSLKITFFEPRKRDSNPFLLFLFTKSSTFLLVFYILNDFNLFLTNKNLNNYWFSRSILVVLIFFNNFHIFHILTIIENKTGKKTAVNFRNSLVCNWDRCNNVSWRF